MSSRIIFVIACLAVLGVFYAYAVWQPQDGPQPAAEILDEQIFWEELERGPAPAKRLANLVDEKIGFALASELGIDISTEAARAYIQSVAPEYDPEQQRRDQQTASKVADALESVFLDGASPESVFQEQNLAEIMTEPRWQELVSSSSPAHIPTLRRFAASPTPVNEPELEDEVVALYLYRSLRDKVCVLPEQYGNIRERLLEKVAYDESDPLLSNVAVFEAECEVEFASYVSKRLDESVSVYREELENYREYLLLLQRSALIDEK